MPETNWRAKGVEAGKTDGWMRLDKDILREDIEAHPQYARSPEELVENAQNNWEETGHFSILYGHSMQDDAYDPDTREFDPDKYSDIRSEFWEGFIEGSKSNPYVIARKLLAGKKGKGIKAKSKSRAKTGTSLGGMR